MSSKPLKVSFRLAAPAPGSRFPRVAWRLALAGTDDGLAARWMLALIMAGVQAEIGAGSVAGIGQEAYEKALAAYEKAREPRKLPKNPKIRAAKWKIVASVDPWRKAS